MKTIVMNSQDLGRAGTIDTYQTFDGNGVEDIFVEDYNEEHGTGYTTDDFEWNYNWDNIVKCLAETRARALVNDSPAIQDVKVLKVGSPKYYNYSTDWARFEITYDDDKVNDYIEKNAEDYKEWRSRNWATTIDWREEKDEKDKLEEMSRLDYFLNKTTYDYDEGWYWAVAEYEREIYMENLTMELRERN